jgi:ketosteroid isomerase-like protein
MTQDRSPAGVLDRLAAAMNAHDLEAFLDCFAEDYESEQPAHPARAFHGREQVRKNWSQMFAGVPDFHADVLRSAVDGDTVWTEWRWTGTRQEGSDLDNRGATIFGVREGRIVWGRLYLEQVEEAGAGIDETMSRLTRLEG